MKTTVNRSATETIIQVEYQARQEAANQRPNVQIERSGQMQGIRHKRLDTTRRAKCRCEQTPSQLRVVPTPHLLNHTMPLHRQVEVPHAFLALPERLVHPPNIPRRQRQMCELVFTTIHRLHLPRLVIVKLDLRIWMADVQEGCWRCYSELAVLPENTPLHDVFAGLGFTVAEEEGNDGSAFCLRLDDDLSGTVLVARVVPVEESPIPVNDVDQRLTVQKQAVEGCKFAEYCDTKTGQSECEEQFKREDKAYRIVCTRLNVQRWWSKDSYPRPSPRSTRHRLCQSGHRSRP